ncbi:hypothetical protein JCM5296_000004 [Sporobolomyces johnsonii]
MKSLLTKRVKVKSTSASLKVDKVDDVSAKLLVGWGPGKCKQHPNLPCFTRDNLCWDIGNKARRDYWAKCILDPTRPDVTLEKPLNNHLFDVPRSRQHESKASMSKSTIPKELLHHSLLSDEDIKPDDVEPASPSTSKAMKTRYGVPSCSKSKGHRTPIEELTLTSGSENEVEVKVEVKPRVKEEKVKMELDPLPDPLSLFCTSHNLNSVARLVQSAWWHGRRPG